MVGRQGAELPQCAGMCESPVQGDPGRPDAAWLDALLSDPDLSATMRQAARPSILQFDWQHVAARVHHLYNELLSEASHAQAVHPHRRQVRPASDEGDVLPCAGQARPEKASRRPGSDHRKPHDEDPKADATWRPSGLRRRSR